MSELRGEFVSFATPAVVCHTPVFVFSPLSAQEVLDFRRDSSRWIVLNFLIPYRTTAFRDGGNENTPSRLSFPFGPLHIT